jgi:acyl-CoA oxidase
MPLLAQNIVYYIASIKAICSWDENQVNTQDPSHPMIEQLHAISSVLKARTSWYASDVIRECRQMLGGNGFHSYSKLGVLFNDNDVNLTWEGDNHVLIQQTSKYVLEQAQSTLMKGKVSNNPLLVFLIEVKI